MLRFIIFLGVIALLGACKETNEQQEAQVVVAHLSAIPAQFRPVALEDEDKVHIFQYIHSFMLREDFTTNELVPQTLKSIPKFNIDENCYELALNPNAKFDDGSIITAKDIAFTLKAFSCYGISNQRRGNFENFERIEIVDDQNLKIFISEKSVQDVILLSDYPILQESIYDTASVVSGYTFNQIYNEFDSLANSELIKWCKKMNGGYFGTFKKNLHGAGAYELTTWENDRIILSLKKNHWTQLNDNWMDKSYASQIVFKLNSDITTKTLDLKNELVAVSIDYSSKQIADFREDSSITNYYNIHAEPASAVSLVALNVNQELSGRAPIFSDQKVRQAIALSLPVQAAIDKLSSGNVQRVASFISINSNEYNVELEPYEYNLEKASALLEESGWKDTDQDGILDKLIEGEKVDMILDFAFPPHPTVEAIVSLFQASLAEIGVKVNFVNGRDWQEKVADKRAFDLVFYSIANLSGHTHPYTLVLSEGIADGYNYAGYDNPLIDSLITIADATFNDEARKDLLFKIQEILYHDLPYVYVGTGKRGFLVHKKYGNVNTSGITPMVRLNTLKLKE